MDVLAQPENPCLDDAGALVLPSLAKLFCLPGDWAIFGVATYLPSAAQWLGLEAGDYGSAYSAAVSLVVWAIAMILLIMASAAVRDLDRAVTRGLSKAASEAMRQVRMAIARFKYRHGSKQRTEPVIEVAEQARCRCYGSVQPNHRHFGSTEP
jgi:hypothetical protein